MICWGAVMLDGEEEIARNRESLREVREREREEEREDIEH